MNMIQGLNQLFFKKSLLKMVIDKHYDISRSQIRENESEVEIAIRRQGNILFKQQLLKNFQFTDKLFSILMVFQWLAGILVAICISPRTWSGEFSQVHIHVWTAVILGGLITFYPVFLALTQSGKVFTRHTIAVGQALMSALLIHLSGGRIETHFHVFVSLAFLAFYRDWKVLISATIVVAADHWIRGVYWPQSVYGVLTISSWRWVEHTGWVLFEDLVLAMSCLQNVKQMKDIAYQTAKLEAINEIEEAKIEERTRQLSQANLELKKEIADRQRIEKLAIQSEKMAALGQLAGGIAHDLNNGLTPVIGYIDFLLGETKQKKSAHEMLSEARQSAKRCADVVEQLLSYSRPSNQVKRVIHLQKVFEEYKTILRTVLPSTIGIQVHCPEDTRPIFGNETEIMTVLMNLAVNSRDAMVTNGGQFSIEAKNFYFKSIAEHGFPEGNYVVISISDTGTGMSSEIVERIFEPFFTTKVKGRGTGLGLSMVFNIIKHHSGWINVSSQKGSGTTFQIYLPVAAEGAVLAKQDGEDLSHVAKGHEKILFVDDEEMLRSMAKVFLGHAGYEVLFAENGEEAIQIYQKDQKNISLVILDMTMPKMTGRQIIRRLKEIDPHTKIIASSGYTSEGSVKDLMHDGVSAFLAKPYTIKAMAGLIRRVLDGKGERDERKNCVSH